MLYQNMPIEILSRRKTFGKEVTQIKILSTGQVLDVLANALQEEGGVSSLDELVFRSIAALIRHELTQQNLLAPLESNVVPLPHQILALEKVMNGAYLRFLMADEVGMGKTIETGLVLKELKLRAVVKRTLIIVPLSAMQQWRSEMKKHFNEDFHIYDADYLSTMTKTFSRLDADNEINFWKQHNQIIVSLDALKPIEARQSWSKEEVAERNRFRIENVLDADFDLLVIDECHKVGGSDVTVGRFQMASTLCEAIPNVLLLSATPHRGKSDHFRRILTLLDADAFSGEGMPSLKELEPYVVRTEKRQAIDYNGKALFNKRNTELVIADYDGARHARQKALFEKVTRYVVDGFNLSQQTKNTSYGFVMVLFQRLISSSTQAILDAMTKRLKRLQAEKNAVNTEQVTHKLIEQGVTSQQEFNFDAIIADELENTKIAYDAELGILTDLVRAAQDCSDNELDVKLEELLKRLEQLRIRENNSDLKFLIFTEFTSTQTMLVRELAQRAGYICVSINGSMDFESRVEALKQFKGSAQVLISTDAAGESLNMQFAHIVINYDLPWNPMVLEQRIGRVDRIGQNVEVLALNFMINNSIDARVYDVIETKLNQIMQELGIDKTADVLDSTLETKSITNLFMASLLDPQRFKGESEEWLALIKEKLQNFKATEGSLPTADSRDISKVKVDVIQYSPLPKWLELMACAWLRQKNIQYSVSTLGIKTSFPRIPEKYYTFDTKTGLENPIPEPLTVQHEIIQMMLHEAVPQSATNPIPQIAVNDAECPEGFFMLWNIKASNKFESREQIIPMFISNDGDVFSSFAQKFWTQFSAQELCVTLQESIIDAAPLFAQLSAKSEALLIQNFEELAQIIESRASQSQQNKLRAFEFQLRQVEKIGIEKIRNHRTRKYKEEYELWQKDFVSAARVVPELNCLLMLKVCHG